MFKGLFGQHFQEKWNGNSDTAGLRDKLGVIGGGISQLYAGQAPNIAPAWQAVEDRRVKRKLGESMSNPALLAGFTPEQQSMLSAMPPEMAQSLIMEKIFAPPPEAVKPDWQQFNGDLYDMAVPPGPDGKRVPVLDGMGDAEIAAAKDAAEREKRRQDGLMLGYADGSPEMNQYVVSGEMVKGPEWRTATPEEAAANGAVAGQINTVTNKFDPQNPPSGMAITTNPDGTMTFEQGPGVKTKPMTESQSKDLGFAVRAEPAADSIDKYADDLVGASGRVGAVADIVPLGLAKGAQTDGYQLGRQAAGEFATTMLRKDSGAAVPPEEYAAFDRNYIPQPGDGDAVLEQKKNARRRMIDGLKAGLTPEAVMAQASIVGEYADAPPPPADAGKVMRFDANGNLIP